MSEDHGLTDGREVRGPAAIAAALAVADGRAMVVVPCEMVLTVAGDRIVTGLLTFHLDALRRKVGATPV